MALLEREEAETALAPHLNAIKEIVAGAWSDYISKYSLELRATHTRTTRANVVHDHMVERAARYAQVAIGVRIHESQKMMAMVIETNHGVIAMRLKKFGDDLRSQNQSTGQVDGFRMQLPLSGFEETHNFDAGYTINEMAQELSGVYVVCLNGSGNYWEIALTDEGIKSIVTDLFDHRQFDEGEAEIRRRKDSGEVRPFKRDTGEQE